MGAGTVMRKMATLRSKQLRSLKSVGFGGPFGFLKFWQSLRLFAFNKLYMKLIVHAAVKSDESPLLYTGACVCTSLSLSI